MDLQQPASPNQPAQPSHYGKLLFVFLVIVLVGLGAYLLQKKSSPSDKQQTQSTTKVDSYGIGGQVVSVNGNSFVISATIVKPDGPGKPETVQRTITVSSSTVYKLLVLKNGKTTQAPGNLSDVKVGVNTNISTKQNIFTDNSLAATEVDIFSY
jgi:hypothetical protein